MFKKTELEKFKTALQRHSVIVIGAGAGLSTSAGFTYSGDRFEKYFFDFKEKYGFEDMYSGGFYEYGSLEEHWAYWSRYIYINRYMNPGSKLYEEIYDLVKDKDYFVLTTNVDHCFQKAGFDKARLFYTQGDYGLFQCSEPCHSSTYENEEIIKKMVLDQGFVIEEEGTLKLPEGVKPKMKVDSSLLPHCPICGKDMSMNLRADDTFVQDAGWDDAARRYTQFLQDHVQDEILFLELGVGYNTPGIIKYPFWRMCHQWPHATYACLNYDYAQAPREIQNKSICLQGDIAQIIEELKAAD